MEQLRSCIREAKTSTFVDPLAADAVIAEQFASDRVDVRYRTTETFAISRECRRVLSIAPLGRGGRGKLTHDE